MQSSLTNHQQTEENLQALQLQQVWKGNQSDVSFVEETTGYMNAENALQIYGSRGGDRWKEIYRENVT